MKRSGVVINFWLRLSTEPESTWPQEEGEGEAGCLSMSIQSKETNHKLPATEQGQGNLAFTKLRILVDLIWAILTWCSWQISYTFSSIYFKGSSSMRTFFVKFSQARVHQSGTERPCGRGQLDQSGCAVLTTIPGPRFTTPSAPSTQEKHRLLCQKNTSK